MNKTQKEIYIDTYILVNIIMNWAALKACAGILTLKSGAVKTLIASSVGALIAAAALITGIDGFPLLILWLVTPAAMSLIAFAKLSAKSLLLASFVLLICGLASGGAVGAITNAVGVMNGITKTKLSVLVIGVGITVTVIRLFGFTAAKKLNRAVATVRIEAFSKKTALLGLCDSGNLLREPISGYPVIILSSEAARGFVGDDYCFAPHESKTNFFAVPLKTVAGNKVIYGFMPDKVTLKTAAKNKETVINKVIIAVDKDTKDFSGYACLVPGEII